MIGTVEMLDSGFKMFGKILDKIPNFDQRKKTEYFKELEKLEASKVYFKEYTNGPLKNQISTVIMGLKSDIEQQRKTVYHLQEAFCEIINP